MTVTDPTTDLTAADPTTVPVALTELLRPYLRFAGDAAIAPDSDLRHLGLDSMQAVELLFAVEDEFGVSLDDDLMTDETFRTAANLWNALRASGRVAEGAA